MSQITYIIVSEQVFENPGEGRVIAKPYSSLFLPGIPSNFSFAVSFGIVDLRYNKDYQVKIQIIDPEKNIITDQEFTHRLEKDSDSIVTTDLTFYCTNFLFNSEGHYVISISLDGDVKELTLPVYRMNRSGN